MGCNPILVGTYVQEWDYIPFFMYVRRKHKKYKIAYYLTSLQRKQYQDPDSLVTYFIFFFFY